MKDEIQPENSEKKEHEGIQLSAEEQISKHTDGTYKFNRMIPGLMF
ncbi:MAG TPA: hypothetical protein VFG10_08570 [Saprospiraceae bacterium]|nr:hypothetical protein [Saprospiraceae bacterium]